MRFEAEVTGLQDFKQALEQVEQKVTLRILRAAVRNAARKTIIPVTKAKMPYSGDDNDGYSLRDAVNIRAEKKRYRTSAVQFRVGPMRETATGAEAARGYRIAGGLSKSGAAPNYAQLVAVEAMEAAYTSQAGQFVDQFADHMRKQIVKGLPIK